MKWFEMVLVEHVLGTSDAIVFQVILGPFVLKWPAIRKRLTVERSQVKFGTHEH